MSDISDGLPQVRMTVLSGSSRAARSSLEICFGSAGATARWRSALAREASSPRASISWTSCCSFMGIPRMWRSRLFARPLPSPASAKSLAVGRLPGGRVDLEERSRQAAAFAELVFLENQIELEISLLAGFVRRRGDGVGVRHRTALRFARGVDVGHVVCQPVGPDHFLRQPAVFATE